MDVLSRGGQRHRLARRRRFAAADLGNEQLVVGAADMGEGGFAEPFDQFDDAFGDEGPAVSRTRCSGRTPIVTASPTHKRRRRQIEAAEAGAGHAGASTLDAFDPAPRRNSSRASR